MFALRLMTGACVGMAALRVTACASLSLLGDRSWFGAMALWLKMVALGAPLASTAGHAMRHEPFSFPPNRPFKGVLWEVGTPGFTEVPYFGVLVPWVRIRRSGDGPPVCKLHAPLVHCWLAPSRILPRRPAHTTAIAWLLG